MLAVVVSAVCLGFGNSETEFESQAKEYPVKAAMMGKFLKYVAWPDVRFETDTSPMVVGVFGKDPFGKSIDRVFAGESYGTHPYQVRRLATLEGVEKCHVLFVPVTSKDRVREIAKYVAGRGVLLIGESDGFAANGGVINFYFENRNPRFEVNPNAAKRQQIKISSSLLKLARIVKDPK